MKKLRITDMNLLPLVVLTFLAIATVLIIFENIREARGSYTCNPALAHVDLSDPTIGLELEVNRGDMQDAYDRANESDEDRAAREFGDMA